MSGNFPSLEEIQTSKDDVRVDDVCIFSFYVSESIKYAWIFKNKHFKSVSHSICSMLKLLCGPADMGQWLSVNP